MSTPDEEEARDLFDQAMIAVGDLAWRLARRGALTPADVIEIMDNAILRFRERAGLLEREERLH